MTSGQDQPLTRRQLRELERAQADQRAGTEGSTEAEEFSQPASVDADATVEPEVVAELETEVADDFHVEVETEVVAEPVVEAEIVADSEVDIDSAPALTTEPATDVLPEHTLTRRELRLLVEQQQAHEADELDEPESDPELAPKAAVTVEPIAIEALETDSAPSVSNVRESALDIESLVIEGKDTVAPPPEHWVQDMQSADDLDLNEPFDAILARGITAAGPVTTTSALIMPEINSPRTGPVPITGEILVTGSLDLPRSLGSTGQHPNHFENSDVDKLFDGLDDATQVADVAPVKASRAVSSHASARGVMAPPTRGGSTLPTALAITAGVLTLAVIGLFVAGVFFNAF